MSLSKWLYGALKCQATGLDASLCHFINVSKLLLEVIALSLLVVSVYILWHEVHYFYEIGHIILPVKKSVVLNQSFRW